MQLTLAVGPAFHADLTTQLEAMTAGRWRRHITLVQLSDDRRNNEQIVRSLAVHGTSTTIFAAADLTPTKLENDHDNVRRFSRRNFEVELQRWLHSRRLSWKGNYEQLSQLGAFKWANADDWRAQFAEVNPKIGARVAEALLAQLDVLPARGLLDRLLDGPDLGRYNACFLGSDPHSGDYALMSGLAQRIAGANLFEASQLPNLPSGVELSLFADGAWSGGESVRRLSCIATPCNKKKGYVGPTNSISMRFGYLTDTAENELTKELNQLVGIGRIKSGRILCSVSGKLVNSSATGLAFGDKDILRYVDSTDLSAMKKLCEEIGQQLVPRRPLGTKDICSTLAFEHSLPKAMLPVFIFSGLVKSHQGKHIKWRPLIRSEHVLLPGKSKTGYHCYSCPLKN